METPWEEEQVFTRILMHDPNKKASFHKIDLFHTISLGIGKAFAASCICILQTLVPGNSIESRLRELSSLYIEFCRDVWDKFVYQSFMFLRLVGYGWVDALDPFKGYVPTRAGLLPRNITKRTMSKRLTGRCWGGRGHRNPQELGAKGL